MYGVVTKYFNEKGYGFIECITDGETYFLHRKDLNGEYVEAGCYVYFTKYKSNRRKNNAIILNMIEAPEHSVERKISHGKAHK